MEKLPMRDQQAASKDRENSERRSVATPLRVAGDHASSTDRNDDPADSPASLSAASHPADAEEAGLSDEEILIYRRRIAEGLYNSPDVADEVARRMMKRGDI